MTFLHPYCFIFYLLTVNLIACDGNNVCFCTVSICHHWELMQAICVTRREGTAAFPQD